MSDISRRDSAKPPYEAATWAIELTSPAMTGISIWKRPLIASKSMPAMSRSVAASRREVSRRASLADS